MSRVVCHLIASNFAGGPEKQILQHCLRLRDRGWEAVIGSFLENRPRVELIEAAETENVSTFLIDTKSPFSPGAVSQLRRFLLEHKADVLITHGYKSNVVGWLASRGRRWSQVPFIRGYTAETWRVRRYEALDRWILRRMPHVLCVSQGTRKRLEEEFGLRRERITVIHNAVDCELSSRIRPRRLHGEFAFPEGARVLVAAGRLSPEKGHRILLKALAHLAGHEPPIALLILGAGAEEGSLREQARNIGLETRVAFAGHRRNPLEYLASADVVVNPSFTEGLPNVILEACSLGRPVVATSVGGTPELVQAGRTGWLVPPGDSSSMAAAIVEAIDDETKAAQIGSQARSFVERHFSFTKQAKKLVQVYESVLTHSVGV